MTELFHKSDWVNASGGFIIPCGLAIQTGIWALISNVQVNGFTFVQLTQQVLIQVIAVYWVSTIAF
ncbi:MAG: hypothetical protein IPN94_22685 [Sphingobacteriales bacterium]|nr:hypothetical protein [Sphingobacteriales bacterium]